jgi:diaminohydroxyphosphoribosylaminopyrimidine deaminase/5-amino-6-(5-phosphoribosylamino)uracil reductase
VVIGAGTAIQDDPALSARLDGSPRQPLRVVVDSRLRTPPGARLLTAPGGKVLIATTAAADPGRVASLEQAGAEVLVLPARDGRVDLAALLAALGGRNVISVLVEGGAEVLGSFVDERLIDAVVAIIAPRLIGGAQAPGAVGGRGAASLTEALELTEVDVERLGGDLIVTGYCVR